MPTDCSTGSGKRWTDNLAGREREVPELMLLGRIPGVGPGRILSLVNSLGSPGAVRRTGLRTLAAVPGIGPRTAEGIRHFFSRAGLAAEEDEVRSSLHRLSAAGGAAIDIWDPGYPHLLSRIYAPPPVLFYLGVLPSPDTPTIAVVGTRRPSHNGLEIAGYFGRELAAAGLTVVSGLARGIDTRAHQSALRAGGRSIAVVGTGPDRCYPPENRGLASDISASGSVISEFEPGTGPEPANFPRRNRVISGLSLGTLVVESDINGGAMITAQMALDQNREVFAVPGRVGSPMSRGCHALIRDGKAKLVESVDDILTEIVCHLPGGYTRPESVAPKAGDLNAREKRLFALLGTEPAHVDSLAESSGLPVQYLIVDLLALEMKGFARQLPGKYFIRAL